MGSWDRDSRCSRYNLRDRHRDINRDKGGCRVPGKYSSSRDMDRSKDRDNSWSKGKCGRDRVRDTALGKGRGGSREANGRVRNNCTVGTRKIALKGSRPVHISTLHNIFKKKTRAKTCSRKYSKAWW